MQRMEVEPLATTQETALRQQVSLRFPAWPATRLCRSLSRGPASHSTCSGSGSPQRLPAGCGQGSGCDEVLNSRWSQFSACRSAGWHIATFILVILIVLSCDLGIPKTDDHAVMANGFEFLADDVDRCGDLVYRPPVFRDQGPLSVVSGRACDGIDPRRDHLLRACTVFGRSKLLYWESVAIMVVASARASVVRITAGRSANRSRRKRRHGTRQ